MSTTVSSVDRISTLRSVVSNWAGLITSALLSLILTPILIRGLGNLYFGMFMLVTSLLDSCWLLDFGMRTAMFRYIARYRGTGEREELNRTFSSGIVLAGISATLIVVLALCAALVLPHFFSVSAADRPIFRHLLVLCGTSVAASYLAQFLGTYQCAFRRFDFYNLNTAFAGILRATLIIAALTFHAGVRTVAAITLFSSLLALANALRLTHLADRDLSFSTGSVSPGRIRELFGFSSSAFLGTLGDQLRFFVDSVVIGRFLGVAFITPFVIPGRIMVLYRELGMSIASPLAGEMSAAAGRANPQELRDRFLHATRMTALLSFLIGLLLLLNGESLIRLWVGPGFSSSVALMLVLLAGYILMIAQQPSVDLLLAQGKHQLRGWWNLAEGAANLVLSIYWARRYGLFGVALGTAVPMIFVQLFLQPWYAMRTISLPMMHYLRDALLRPALCASIVLGVCGAFRTWQHAYSVSWLFLSIAWQAALFVALAWAFALTASERGSLVRRLRPNVRETELTSA